MQCCSGFCWPFCTRTSQWSPSAWSTCRIESCRSCSPLQGSRESCRTGGSGSDRWADACTRSTRYSWPSRDRADRTRRPDGTVSRWGRAPWPAATTDSTSWTGATSPRAGRRSWWSCRRPWSPRLWLGLCSRPCDASRPLFKKKTRRKVSVFF